MADPNQVNLGIGEMVQDNVQQQAPQAQAQAQAQGPDPVEQVFQNLRQEVANVTQILGVQGATQNIKPFDGTNKTLYRDWVRDIEKYRTMMLMAEDNCILLAYQCICSIAFRTQHKQYMYL